MKESACISREIIENSSEIALKYPAFHNQTQIADGTNNGTERISSI